MKTYLFPGQGSQSRGMGGNLFDEFNEWTRKADQILGYSIEELCLEDPRKELNLTQFSQPAIYVVSALSYYKKIKESGQKPDFTAGHSLGEYNALLAAECFDFETGLKLVRKRGELMSEATDGGMAAIINASKDEIEAILKDNKLTNVDLANYNAPSQIVISGLREEIKRAQGFFQEGNMLFIESKTSGAFHSQFMRPAKKQFEIYLKKFEFSNLKIPVIANVSAEPYKNNEIKTNMVNQITSAVEWNNSIQYLMEQGDMEFEEIGHGNILTKLVQKIKAEAPKSPKKDIDGPAETQGEEIASTPELKTEKYQQQSKKPDIHESPKATTAEEKVIEWNDKYPIGTKVKSAIIEEDGLETRTEAVVLFGHRAAVYMKGYNGYFDIDEITPL